MISFITAYTSRLIVGGFIVFAIMAVSGKGGLSESVRLCCACFMIILILTPARGDSVSADSIAAAFENAEALIEESVSLAEENRISDINEGVEDQIENILRQSYPDVNIDIYYTSDENAGYMPVGVCISGIKENDSEIVGTVCRITGISPENVTFGGE